MTLSIENLERRKKILLAASAIALGAVALRKNKAIGDKIYSTSVWEASQTVVADIIAGSKGIGGRLSAKLVRDANNEVVDVVPSEEREEILEELIEEYEDVFINGDWTEAGRNTLQTD